MYLYKVKRKDSANYNEYDEFVIAWDYRGFQLHCRLNKTYNTKAELIINNG